jgi:transcription elongation factor Elf1
MKTILKQFRNRLSLRLFGIKPYGSRICANCGLKQPSICSHNIQLEGSNKWGFSCINCYLRYEINFKIKQIAYDNKVIRESVEAIENRLRQKKHENPLATTTETGDSPSSN